MCSKAATCLLATKFTVCPVNRQSRLRETLPSNLGKAFAQEDRAMISKTGFFFSDYRMTGTRLPSPYKAHLIPELG